jgi:hypothetical protein
MGKQKFDAVVLVNSFKETVRLAKDAKDQPLAIFSDNPGVCHPLRSERVTRALRVHAKMNEMQLNKNRLEELVDELDALAYEEGESITVHYRVAPVADGYTYHLGGSWYLLVAQGIVSVVNKPPYEIYFMESSTMLAAPVPTLRVDVPALLRWFNCDNAQKLLLLAWLTYTVATPKAAKLPYPILVVRAPAGSGKTFICSKVIRQLVDPSLVASQAMPKTIKEVALSASQSHLLVYDNIRFIRHELSDGLCQVATGGSTVGRKLYTDGQEFSMDLRCPLVLNGIHTFVTESDLVSRCVNINLAPIGIDQRKSEGSLGAKFDEELPSLIYTLHVLAAKVLAVKDKVEVRYKSRMADFSVWVAGLETVLKLPQDQLQNAYRKNVEQAKVAGVVDDSLFVALCNFATRYPKTSSWHGTPHELLSALEAQTAVSLGSDMPKNAAAMSRRLPMIQDALASNGVYVDRGRASARYYNVWFEPKANQSRGECDDVADPSVTPTQPSREDQSCEENDGVAESLLG